MRACWPKVAFFLAALIGLPAASAAGQTLQVGSGAAVYTLAIAAARTPGKGRNKKKGKPAREPGWHKVMGRAKKLATTSPEQPEVLLVPGGKALRVQVLGPAQVVIRVARFYGKPAPSRKPGAVTLQDGRTVLRQLDLGEPDPTEEDPWGVKQQALWRVAEGGTIEVELPAGLRTLQLKAGPSIRWGVGVALAVRAAGESSPPAPADVPVASAEPGAPPPPVESTAAPPPALDAGPTTSGLPSVKPALSYQSLALVDASGVNVPDDPWYRLEPDDDFLLDIRGPIDLSLRYRVQVPNLPDAGDDSLWNQEHTVSIAVLLDEVLVDAVIVPARLDRDRRVAIPGQASLVTRELRLSTRIGAGEHQLRVSFTDEGYAGGLVTYFVGTQPPAAIAATTTAASAAAQTASLGALGGGASVYSAAPILADGRVAGVAASTPASGSLVDGGLKFAERYGTVSRIGLSLGGGLRAQRLARAPGYGGRFDVDWGIGTSRHRFTVGLATSLDMASQALNVGSSYGLVQEHTLALLQVGCDALLGYTVELDALLLQLGVGPGLAWLAIEDRWSAGTASDSALGLRLTGSLGVGYRLPFGAVLLQLRASLARASSATILRAAPVDGLAADLGYRVAF